MKSNFDKETFESFLLSKLNEKIIMIEVQTNEE
jgi:hypothetical protein